MMRGLLFFASLGFGMCDLELMQSGVEVDDAFTASLYEKYGVQRNDVELFVKSQLRQGESEEDTKALIQKIFALEEEEAAYIVGGEGSEAALESNWGSPQGRRRRVSFAGCHYILTPGLAAELNVQAGYCIGHDGKCQIQAEGGGGYVVSGTITFDSTDCKSRLSGGSISFTKNFEFCKKCSVNLGPLGTLDVRAVGSVTIQFEVNNHKGMSLYISIKGTLSIRVGDASASASLHGKVGFEGIGNGASPHIVISMWIHVKLHIGIWGVNIGIELINSDKFASKCTKQYKWNPNRIEQAGDLNFAP